MADEQPAGFTLRISLMDGATVNGATDVVSFSLRFPIFCGDGSPLANPGVPGPLVVPASDFSLCMANAILAKDNGHLWVDDLLTLQLHGNGAESTWVTICGDTLRGPASGVVGSGSVLVSNLPIVTVIRFDKPEVEPAFELVALEAVQTIQDWTNSIPMIEGKSTYVRAHIQTKGTTSRNVSAELYGYRNGQELPESPQKPINTGGVLVVGPNAAERRGTFKDSLNFKLPESWLSGTVKLQMVSPKGQIDFIEPAEANRGGVLGDGAITVTFEDDGNLEVRFVRLVGPDGQDIPETVSVDDVKALTARLTAAYPVRMVGYSTVTMPWLDDTTVQLEAVNQLLVAQRANDGCMQGCRQYYYAAIGGDVDLGGLANGIPGTVASGTIHETERPAHELGHLIGRHHAVHSSLTPEGSRSKRGACPPSDPSLRETAAWTAPDFPYFFSVAEQTRATIGPMDQGDNQLIYGLDTCTLTTITPTERFELMSYCLPRWISDFTYEGLHTTFVAVPPMPPADGVPDTYIILRGTVDFAADTVELLPFGKVTTASQPEIPESGDYLLELRDETHQVLASIPFAPQRSVGSEGGLMDTGSFLMVLPDDPTVRHYRVLYGEKTLATASASNTVPEVSLLSPNGGEVIHDATVTVTWFANDPDGDELSYTILYSADGGVTWRCLGVDLSGGTSCVVQRESLAGSQHGLFKVIASDGVLTGSDVSDAVFTVGDNVPTVRILAPVSGSVATFDQQIAFEASGYDVEDGSLPASRIQWSSNLDGVLGTGTLILRRADELSSGLHRITAIATDSKGQQASAEVELGVSRIAGDISRDGRVDLTDLRLLVQEWQRKNCSAANDNCSFCDVDGSGKVDLGDFGVMADNWMK